MSTSAATPDRHFDFEWRRDIISPQLADKILRSLLDGADDGASTRPARLVTWTRRSAIYRCSVQGKSYAVKIFGPMSPRNHTAEAAFRALSALHREDPQQMKLSVPRPVATSQDFNTLVMDWIDAPNLQEYAACVPSPDALDAVRAASAWLAKLHDTFPRPGVETDRDLYLNNLTSRIPKKSEHLDRRDSRRLKNYTERLAGLVDAYRDGPFPKTMLHGDATCSNFCYDGQRAIALDFYMDHAGDPALDFAMLIMQSELRMGRLMWEKTPWMISRPVLQAVVAQTDMERNQGFFSRLRINLFAYALRLLCMNPPGRDFDWQRSCILSVMAGTALNELHPDDL
ncbi:MAG: aminoglycoside phosphotransferase family protein [Devosia sp.]